MKEPDEWQQLRAQPGGWEDAMARRAAEAAAEADRLSVNLLRCDGEFPLITEVIVDGFRARLRCRWGDWEIRLAPDADPATEPGWDDELIADGDERELTDGAAIVRIIVAAVRRALRKRRCTHPGLQAAWRYCPECGTELDPGSLTGPAALAPPADDRPRDQASGDISQMIREGQPPG